MAARVPTERRKQRREMHIDRRKSEVDIIDHVLNQARVPAHPRSAGDERKRRSPRRD